MWTNRPIGPALLLQERSGAIFIVKISSKISEVHVMTPTLLSVLEEFERVTRKDRSHRLLRRFVQRVKQISRELAVADSHLQRSERRVSLEKCLSVLARWKMD